MEAQRERTWSPRYILGNAAETFIYGAIDGSYLTRLREKLRARLACIRVNIITQPMRISQRPPRRSRSNRSRSQGPEDARARPRDVGFGNYSAAFQLRPNNFPLPLTSTLKLDIDLSSSANSYPDTLLQLRSAPLHPFTTYIS
ncbi:hypothetical protein HZ326_15820 [Fusarium oxysporum f. sp. albedinis]|nr:hypothetical protein HZ326_15820 [Fusarium oxysporum f. sp. albedinis]